MPASAGSSERTQVRTGYLVKEGSGPHMKPEKERKKERGSREEQTHPRARSAKRGAPGLFGAGCLLCLPQSRYMRALRLNHPFLLTCSSLSFRLALKLALRGVTLSFEFLKGLQRQCGPPFPGRGIRGVREAKPSPPKVTASTQHSRGQNIDAPDFSLLGCFLRCDHRAAFSLLRFDLASTDGARMKSDDAQKQTWHLLNCKGIQSL